jgi:hypothetical protein
MGADVLINGYDLEKTFGVCMEEGGLSVFEQPPIPREPFFNEWPDQSGRDYDETSAVVYQTQFFEIPFLIIGSTMADYRKKKADFMKLIDFNGSFDFQVIDWGEAYKLRYKEVASWEFINTNLGSETSARFVLRLELNPNVKPSIFKYLVDGLKRYIIINGNQKILVKTSYGN